MKLLAAVAPLLATLLFAAPVSAEAPRSMPMAIAAVSTVPAARDVPYPGTIDLKVDTTDIERRIFRVVETVPVPAGQDELILQLPQWLPGRHASRGKLNLIAGVHFEADGKELTWARDPIEVYAFHVALPAGTTSVTARFVFTSPLQSSEGRVVVTNEMLNLHWDDVSLYPAGYYVRQIPIVPTVTFPAGWTPFTALDGMSSQGSVFTWARTDYEQLVDSPVFAGKYAQRWDLGHNVHLDAVADEAKDLALSPEHLAAFKKLVEEGLALYGVPHFDHYDFLVALTKKMGGIGLEHQRSSESSLDPDSFTKWVTKDWGRNVVAHEFNHSWDGKFRRPAGLWTPDYRQPMQDSLLWVYEGQDQLWGCVLAARSGIQRKDIVLGSLANSAAFYSIQAGREWRSVEDTTMDPIIDWRQPQPFRDYSRNEDYYSESMLVWIEADQIIRQGTKGKKGLDDFAKAFFGVRSGDIGQLTYTFDDLVSALDGVYHYDWATFLHDRLYRPGQPPPLQGLELGGYKLVWKDKPNPFTAALENGASSISLHYSLGFTVDKEGNVSSTYWGSPAFDAKIVTGAQIVAVNGKTFSFDTIKQAITAAKDSKDPIVLLIKRDDRVASVPVDYHRGLSYPWLVPASDGEQPLDKFLAPRAGPLPDKGRDASSDSD